jgi:outer membrane protein assembly factor BamB
MDDGSVVWSNAGNEDILEGDASFGPTSATKQLVFVGGVLAPQLRIYDARNGELLHTALIGDQILLSAVASGAVVVDGTILVGVGIGTLVGNPAAPSEITARLPSSLVALCVPGVKRCPKR